MEWGKNRFFRHRCVMMKKRMKRLLFVTMMILLPISVFAQRTTLKQQMDRLKQEQKVNFVYDSSLNVNRAYQGQALEGKSLKEALQLLFRGTGIEWSVRGNYVTLRQKSVAHTPPTSKEKVIQRHTLSGYVRDKSGESLINATIQCTAVSGSLSSNQKKSHAVTTTNAYGFYSITLPEGDYELQASYLGFSEGRKTIKLNKDCHEDFLLEEHNLLQEVVVTGNMNSPVFTTQTGKKTLSRNDLNTEFALLSSPDLIKTIQRTSGVSEGIEGTSGMYVHGGNDDENLFLLDGTSMYTINHTLGLFSAFNTDVVKNVDFYKSGFPARYGGRLSSVTDVRTNDGDMRHTHGSYSIGLIDGRFQIEGPIKTKEEREKVANGQLSHYSTSYNFGLRRSWLDVITEPIFFIMNKKDDKTKFHYFLHDLNGKITHTFNDRSKAYFSIYSSKDMMNSTYYWDEKEQKEGAEEYHNIEEGRNYLTWGNLNMALNWNYQLRPSLFANFSAVYTHNRSIYEYKDGWRYGQAGSMSVDHMEHTYRSTVDDGTLRADFDFRPNSKNHIRFGGDMTYHDFRPQTQSLFGIYGQEDITVDSTTINSKNHLKAQELNLYAEDEMILNNHWSMNVGVHGTLFHISGKNFFLFDPRAAVKYQVNDKTSLKMSFTGMTQTIHRISSTYLSMPTDYWVPTTANLKPMRSFQIAAGVYSQISRHWFASLEGYYKVTNHILQYTKYKSLTPPVKYWENFVIDGKGRFYGIEADVRYHDSRYDVQAAYTLSWNKRKFDEFYPHWFYDKFDNRHKFSITGRMKIGRNAEMCAGWTYHTGYRMTVATQFAAMPNLPDGHAEVSQQMYTTQEGYMPLYINYGANYDTPNNLTLPAYHRLDLGFNLHHITKAGHERLWNISIYNAYCRFNALYAEMSYSHNRVCMKGKGFIPIIPTASYTIKF